MTKKSAAKTFPVQHIAKLSNLTVTDEEEGKFATAFAETLAVVDQLKELDVTKAQPTYQVTGLINIWRNDEVDEAHMFSQQEALANAKQVHQGYFVVPQILERDE